MSAPGGEGGTPSPAGLGAGAIRDLAVRHGIRPTKALGQHFLIDPNLARAIVADAGIERGDRVVEIGAGLGSLTLALAVVGARVRAIEFDRRLIPALEEATAGLDGVEIVHADAMKFHWGTELASEPWTVCANLPYNISAPLVLSILEDAPTVRRVVVMVQREVGERLAATVGQEGYGAVSVRVAYRAAASIVRRVPASVFWPRPKVASVVVRLDRLDTPPVHAEPERLWRVVDAGFAERRKTMRNALRRLGLDLAAADAVLTSCGVASTARAEELDLVTFAAIGEALPR
ncbi:MAG: 16S rRNA (adenine(1518)-N(6)/adenine(1519)-N(6))-dimethyltransferase RsmA [Actinomycetota bacterium]